MEKQLKSTLLTLELLIFKKVLRSSEEERKFTSTQIRRLLGGKKTTLKTIFNSCSSLLLNEAKRGAVAT